MNKIKDRITNITFSFLSSVLGGLVVAYYLNKISILEAIIVILVIIFVCTSMLVTVHKLFFD